MPEDAKRGRTGERRPWIRTGSVFVRAVHLLAASAVGGAFLLDVPPASAPGGWWIAVAASGGLLLLVEAVRHEELYREVAGWATVTKLLLLGAVAFLPAGAPFLVAAAFVVAVIGAHAPRTWRHRRLF